MNPSFRQQRVEDMNAFYELPLEACPEGLQVWSMLDIAKRYMEGAQRLRGSVILPDGNGTEVDVLISFGDQDTSILVVLKKGRGIHTSLVVAPAGENSVKVYTQGGEWNPEEVKHIIKCLFDAHVASEARIELAKRDVVPDLFQSHRPATRFKVVGDPSEHILVNAGELTEIRKSAQRLLGRTGGDFECVVTNVPGFNIPQRVCISKDPDSGEILVTFYPVSGNGQDAVSIELLFPAVADSRPVAVQGRFIAQHILRVLEGLTSRV